MRLHWESTGEGDPVLLIMGLALPGAAWWRTVPVLAERFRVLTYDHRGVGGSADEAPSFSTSRMAEDALFVLDAAGVEQAHVYGTSLGGLVAQQFALRHPARVRSLVLGATHAGGRRATPPDGEVIDFLRRRPTLPSVEAAWASVPYNYGPRCRRHHVARIAEDIARRIRSPYAARAYRSQLYAGATHDCLSSLYRLDCPTLVVHGRHDRVIPIENATVLADEISGAELEVLEECGHLYTTEEPAVDKLISAFMAAA